MAHPAWAQRGKTLSGGQLRFHRRGGVVQLASPVRLDISARALGLTCYELASFDALIGRASPGANQQQPECRLRDWPAIWVVVVDFGVADVAFAAGPPHASGEAAALAARRTVTELEERSGQPSTVDPESVQAYATSVEELLALGQPWTVVYAPLTPVAFVTFCETDRSSEGTSFEHQVLRLQTQLAWEYTRSAALAVRSLPHLVQRRIFAFAFSPRALGGR